MALHWDRIAFAGDEVHAVSTRSSLDVKRPGLTDPLAIRDMLMPALEPGMPSSAAHAARISPLVFQSDTNGHEGSGGLAGYDAALAASGREAMLNEVYRIDPADRGGIAEEPQLDSIVVQGDMSWPLIWLAVFASVATFLASWLLFAVFPG